MTAENGEFDKIPTRRFLKLPFPAEVVDAALALVTFLAESDHKHFVLRNPLIVHVDDVVVSLDGPPADAIWMLVAEPITVASLGGVHATARSCARQ